MNPVEMLVAQAKGEVNYYGKLVNDVEALYDAQANPGGKYTKYAYELDKLGDFYNGKKNGYDWCDVFVDWCFYKVFGKDIGRRMIYQPPNSLGAGCKYSMLYYKQNNAFTTTPKVGTQIFFGTSTVVSHTGIVIAVRTNEVVTVEGNAGNPSAVRVCTYNKNTKSIVGYGIPNYKLAEEVIMKMNTPSNWAKEAVDWAVKNKISDGTNLKENTTREQTIVMLYRLYNLIKEGK